MCQCKIFVATVVLFVAGIANCGEKLPSFELLQRERQSLRKKVKLHNGIVIAEVKIKKFEQAFTSSDLISSPDLIRTTTYKVIRIKKVVSGPMAHEPDKEYSQTISVGTRRKNTLNLDRSQEEAKHQKLKYQLSIADGKLTYRFEALKQDTPNSKALM